MAEQVARLTRLFRQVDCHAVLIGELSSGRRSAARLAAHISDCHVLEVLLPNKTASHLWRLQLRNAVIKIAATNRHVVFLVDVSVCSVRCHAIT